MRELENLLTALGNPVHDMTPDEFIHLYESSPGEQNTIPEEFVKDHEIMLRWGNTRNEAIENYRGHFIDRQCEKCHGLYREVRRLYIFDIVSERDKKTLTSQELKDLMFDVDLELFGVNLQIPY